ncbi:MAG TPA: NAD+ synthase [Rhodanobacteraceae bacterium]|nr:NAD+ synthase [Rhodanobacteraceae bacterium]
MPTLRFALAQMDFPVGAVAANAARMQTLLAEARDGGASLVAFPELAICGYPPEDLLLRPSFLAACARELDALAAATNGVAAYVGHPHAQGEVYNAGSLLRDGRIEVTYHKQALPNYTVFDEKRYFRPGHEAKVVEIDGVRVGLLVCEDIWEAEPAARAARAGAEMLLIINASPFDIPQAKTREELLAHRARENDVAIAYVNVVGGQDDLLFDGGALLVERDGRIAARAPQFVDALLFAEYDATSRRFAARDWPAIEDNSVEAIVYEGIARGIRDYVTKNGFPGVLLGLSGGIDSALTLALAVDALGAGRCTAVMMPSRYTSDLSLGEAEAQARKLGVAYHVLPIEQPFEALRATLAPVFAGKPEDITEENLQARCRGVLLMAMSNKLGGLVLSTGNKSEMAVGYATLYGDMCGGYAPLKDVFKTLVWSLSRWRNAQEADGAWVIPPVVIDRPPSAELRNNQLDQDSLPPYDVLDAILERFVDREESQAEIVAAGFDESTVRRVARLVLGSEYKRRQSAPGPKVTTRAFGRNRRYPISSGWR